MLAPAVQRYRGPWTRDRENLVCVRGDGIMARSSSASAAKKSEAGQASEAASQAGIHPRGALHDGRRIQRLLPRIRRAEARRPRDDARARLRALRTVPAADGAGAGGRVPHARSRPAGLRAQRQGRRPARRARPRARCRALPRRQGDRAGDPGRQLDGMPRHLRVRVPVPRADRPGGARVPGRRDLQPAAAAGHGAAHEGRSARAAEDGEGRDARLPAVRRARAPSRCSRR